MAQALEDWQAIVFDCGQEIPRGAFRRFRMTRDGAADDVSRFSSSSLVFLLQEFLKRRLSRRRHIGGCELLNRPRL
jgi:hypothetical protein